MDASRFLSRRMNLIPEFSLTRFFELANGMEGVISLGIGEPDFVTPKVLTEAGIASLRAGKTGYTVNAGILELREALSEYLESLYGLRYDPADEILFTIGVSEAFTLALMAVVDPGDEVIIAEPSFVAYEPIVTMAGGTPVPVATYVEEDFQLRASDVEKALTPRTKAILISYPNNPTGAVMDREHLEALAEVAERHDLLVISDEIYDRLVYGVEHIPFASLPGMRERTVHLGGFSKSHAMTGWRLGYAAAPAPLLDGMLRLHQYSIMTAPTPAQYAALEAFRNPAAEDAVREMLEAYDARRRLIVDGLNSIGLETFEPFGAFYAFPSVEVTGMDGEEFSRRLLEEERVAVVPGSAFGVGGENFVRCSYAASMEDIEEALERMARFVQRHKLS